MQGLESAYISDAFPIPAVFYRHYLFWEALLTPLNLLAPSGETPLRQEKGTREHHEQPHQR